MAGNVRKSQLKNASSVIVMVTLLVESGTAAFALPSHGHLVSGQGSIGTGNQSLTVKQSSTTGIINWNSFSVGKHQSVKFENGHGATLNRVVGSNLSRIAGSLHATGSLYLMNGSGVIVSGTGHIVTGGSFIATSGNLANSAFNDGQRRFSTTDAKVINRGKIIVGDEAKFVGDDVANRGTIAGAHVKLRATDGNVLAGGSIIANGNQHHAGHILVISDTGETKITGMLNAHNRNGTGGRIETSGYNVSIGGQINAGNGGTWLVDPEDIIVTKAAAQTIASSLNHGANVSLKTTKTSASGPGTHTKGPGNINIEAAISWASNADLSLDAYKGVHVDAPIENGKQGEIAIETSHGGLLSFGNGDAITFKSTAAKLEINGTAYTLVSSIAQLANDVADDPSGNFALSKNYDAKAVGVFGDSPIAELDGDFEGLGHTISGFALNTSDTNAGLIGTISASGSVENLIFSKANIIDNSATYIGVLAGSNAGRIMAVRASGSVNTFEDADVGGLVGANSSDGEIDHSSSSAAVNASTTDYMGGLAGANDGKITYSSATGPITGGTDENSEVGGLVGYNTGDLDYSFAKSTVQTKFGGGLVGENSGQIFQSYSSTELTATDGGGLVYRNDGTISFSHSSGNVNAYFAGGLVAFNDSSIADSYSSASVGGDSNSAGGLVSVNSGTISVSYSTGNVASSGGGYSGGLAAENVSGGAIENSYSRSSVTCTENLCTAGGLVGHNDGVIEQTYSTGAVSSDFNTQLGGLVGFNDGSVELSYWDKQTSGQSSSAGGKGVTTAKLQSGLPSGFDRSIWRSDSHINGGLPYLVALKKSY